MATIGTFRKSGTEFPGQIVALYVQTKNVRITPEATRPSENAASAEGGRVPFNLDDLAQLIDK